MMEHPNEARTAEGGSTVEPQTEPETKATWPHDEATGRKLAPRWSQTGFMVKPENPLVAPRWSLTL